MKTLLQNDVAPLWVWIVVIVVGSLLIIGASIVFYRYCVGKNRSRKARDVESNDNLTKRVILHHGQVVPKTSYLSLASSTFGHFGETNEKDSTSRNASPFDWWAGVKERSASRQSQRSEGTSSNLDNAITPMTTNSFYQLKNSSAPRLSISSFGEKEPSSDIGSISDVSTISKPLIAMRAESRQARTVNFSRPQPKRPQLPTSKNARLSIINETPRQSYLSISSFRARITSWAGSAHEKEEQPEMEETTSKSSTSQQQKQKSEYESNWKVSDKIPRLTLSFEERDPKPLVEPQEMSAITPALKAVELKQTPIDEALEQLNGNSNTTTVEPTTQDQARRSIATELPDAATLETATLVGHSRTSSSTNFSRKPGQLHSRANSTTNFSRKPQDGTHSRSSSANRGSSINFSRLASPVDQSRTNSNTSWFEPVFEATLSEPFDMPNGQIDERISVLSTDIQEAIKKQNEDHSEKEPTAEVEKNAESIPRPKTADYTSTPSREVEKRGRSKSMDRRSREQIRTRSASKGRNVLKKRSLNKPEIQMLGAIDPTTLEHLSVEEK